MIRLSLVLHATKEGIVSRKSVTRYLRCVEKVLEESDILHKKHREFLGSFLFLSITVNMVMS